MRISEAKASPINFLNLLFEISRSKASPKSRLALPKQKIEAKRITGAPGPYLKNTGF